MRRRRWLSRHGADRPIGREELPFLTLAAAAIVAAAQLFEPGRPLDLLLLVLAALAVATQPLLGRVPPEATAAAVAALVAVAVGHSGHLELSFFLVSVVTVYGCWRVGSTGRAVVIAAIGTAGVAAATLAAPSGFSALPWYAAQVLTFTLGRNLHRQDVLITELEAARTELADQAVAMERQRIAREVHDLAGHTITSMLLSVTSARHVLRRDLDEADRALSEAERVGRSSMYRIRTTVGGLRRAERGTDPPIPDVFDLAALVAAHRRTGLDVNVVGAQDTVSVRGPAAAALERICGEALANVARHAPGNTVTITFSFDDRRESVDLEITDVGSPPSAAPTRHDRYGIIGMQERARSRGGSLTAGPNADGWTVRAWIPLGDRCDEELAS